jgi:hypothetical protein
VSDERSNVTSMEPASVRLPLDMSMLDKASREDIERCYGRLCYEAMQDLAHAETGRPFDQEGAPSD